MATPKVYTVPTKTYMLPKALPTTRGSTGSTSSSMATYFKSRTPSSTTATSALFCAPGMAGPQGGLAVSGPGTLGSHRPGVKQYPGRSLLLPPRPGAQPGGWGPPGQAPGYVDPLEEIDPYPEEERDPLSDPLGGVSPPRVEEWEGGATDAVILS